MNTGVKKRAGDRAMRFGRRGDRHGVDFAAQIMPIRKTRALVLGRHTRRGCSIDVADPDKFDAALGSQLAIVARVVPAEAAHTYRGDSNFPVFGHSLIANCFSAILYILI